MVESSRDDDNVGVKNDKRTDRETGKTNGQTEKPEKQTDRQRHRTNRQTDRWTDEQTENREDIFVNFVNIEKLSNTHPLSSNNQFVVVGSF